MKRSDFKNYILIFEHDFIVYVFITLRRGTLIYVLAEEDNFALADMICLLPPSPGVL